MVYLVQALSPPFWFKLRFWLWPKRGLQEIWDGFTKDLSEAKYWLKQAYAHGEDRAEKIYCSSLTPDKQATCKF